MMWNTSVEPNSTSHHSHLTPIPVSPPWFLFYASLFQVSFSTFFSGSIPPLLSEQEHDLLEAFPWIRCQLKRSSPTLNSNDGTGSATAAHEPIQACQTLSGNCQAGAILASGSIRFYVRKFFPCSFFFDRLSPLVV